jgi:hypothetical protein
MPDRSSFSKGQHGRVCDSDVCRVVSPLRPEPKALSGLQPNLFSATHTPTPSELSVVLQTFEWVKNGPVGGIFGRGCDRWSALSRASARVASRPLPRQALMNVAKGPISRAFAPQVTPH